MQLVFLLISPTVVSFLSFLLRLRRLLFTFLFAIFSIPTDGPNRNPTEKGRKVNTYYEYDIDTDTVPQITSFTEDFFDVFRLVTFWYMKKFQDATSHLLSSINKFPFGQKFQS